MNFGFSASNNMFYFLSEEAVYRKNGFWPEDIVPVANNVWAEFVNQPPTGKQRGADDKGLPVWIDFRESECAINQRHENERYFLLKKADDEIRRLNIIKEVNGLNEQEENKLKDWKVYLANLYRLDLSKLSETKWPEIPE